MSIRTLSYCFFVVGISVLCWHVVATKKRTQRTEIHPLCSTDTQYGTVLNTYNDICGLMSCAGLCMDNNQCEACTYDDTSGTCSLNSLIRTNFPTCDRNVKYAQMREYQCHLSGGFRICGLYLHAVSGELSGYIEVNLNGVWGTVCDDYWEENNNGPQNAGVLCRFFGYSDGLTIYPLNISPSYYTGPILMDDVRCAGTEANMLECPHLSSLIADHNCYHYEDVRVRCF